MELPRNRVDMINYIRLQYYINSKFYNYIQEIIKSFSADQKNIVLQLALFGEAFILNNGTVLLPESIKLKSFKTKGSFIFDKEDNEITDVKSYIMRANPYDLRGSSFFNLETLEPIHSIDHIVYHIKEVLK